MTNNIHQPPLALDMLKRKSLSGLAFLRLPFLLLCGILLLLPSSFADQPVDLRIADASQIDHDPLPLTEYFDVLEDPTLVLTLVDVQKPGMAGKFIRGQAETSALNFGFTGSAYWLRLNLRNTSEHPIDRMLEIGYARLSTVQFYQPTVNGAYQSLTTGRAMPFATRPYNNRYFVFPLTLPAKSDQVVFLRIQSTDPILIPARLWARQAFHAHERNDYITQAWYFGIASAMILFNLLLFIVLRDVVYLLYVNFVTFSAIFIASLNGLAHEFLWPDSTLWSNISTFVTVSLSLAALLLFMRSMLNTRVVIPKFDRLLKVFVGIHLLVPIGYVVSLQTFSKFAMLINVATALLIFATGLFCTIKRQRSAYFFVAAFGILLFGGVMTALRSVGVMPTNFFTINGLQIGSAFEMLLLAFALADRFNEIRREKTQAQIEMLEAQRRLVENLQSSERVLEARVAERTDELQILNRKLEALSTTDGLTGIANRRRFDEVLAAEWNRAARMGQPLSLAMLDVDWFKKYNDHYGHQAGDECLRHIANVLKASVCRTGDLVARYGGEEFAFIVPGTDGISAMSMARRVLGTLEALALPHEVSEIGYVTVSIGVASTVPREGESPEILIKNADESLYRAKEQGRNRAVLA